MKSHKIKVILIFLLTIYTVSKAENVKKSKKIKIVEYNPLWVQMYNQEKIIIKKSLGKSCIDIFHIGSTSVPGLAAKPVIDIIAVVKDITKIKGLLESSGYKYKGEYNLPLRSFYGKKTDIKINLHVHEKGSPEIDLNIKFRDYLRSHPEAIVEYANLKKRAAEEKDAHLSVKSGISRYNLNKNNFIEKIIKASGFNGLCPRLCTQEFEWKCYNSVKKNISNKLKKDIESNIKEDNQNHLVLYKGTEIVAAGRLDWLDNKFVSIRFIGLMGNKISKKEHLVYLLNFMEKWARKKGYKIITSIVDNSNYKIYKLQNFKVIDRKNKDLDMIKIL